MVELVKNPPAVQETQAGEDPLKKEMAVHSSIIAWKIPWTVARQASLSMGLQRVRHNWVTNTHYIVEMIAAIVI